MDVAFSRPSLKNRDNFFYLKIFLCILAVLIFLSLLYRSIRLWQESSFTTSSFRILVLAHDAYLVNVDRGSNQLSVGIWKNRGKSLSHNSKLENSLILSAPIDGEITQSFDDSYGQFVQSYFALGNISRIALSHEVTYQGMNIVDILRAYFASKGTPNGQINQEEISKNTSQDDMYMVFKDGVVINEKTSIQIINAADINGLGNRTAEMLENGGFNVVSIDSEDPTPHSKIIYRIAPNTTLTHLRHIFPYRAVYKSESAIADITIILGQDAGAQ